MRSNERCFILLIPSQEEANKIVQEMMIGYRPEEKNQLKTQMNLPPLIRPNLKQFKPCKLRLA
jgi:hypothetical protein